MKKSLDTYSKGDKVKVDRGGAGLGIQFLTIKEGFETDNCNGYKDYTFDELDLPICEYYIRKIKPSDLKLKKLFEEQKIDQFEFDYDEVQKQFWESQRSNINMVKNFINNFLHPYLTEYKHALPVDKMVDCDSYYKKGMHLKNGYFFVIPHKVLNIIVKQGTTYVTLYITAPSDKHEREYNEKSILYVSEISTKYSDDEYAIKMKELTEDIILQFENGYEKGHYIPRPDYTKINAVKSFESYISRGNYSDWQNPIPTIYTYTLRDLNEIKYYVFNKGFK